MRAAASGCCARRCCGRFRARDYTGLEYSEYLCERFGWTQGSLANCRADPFDLVVCYDVLQYLDDRTAARAIANLGRLTRGVLYLSALTAHDWRENCDRSRTDRDVHLRDAAWYGARLRRYFRPSGVGFWIRRGAPLVTWEMETAANLTRARYARYAPPMPEPVLPVDAATGDARHRDVRAQVFAAVPQRRRRWASCFFWRFVLFLARFPAGLKLLARLRGS